jgi:hypothetical protein
MVKRITPQQQQITEAEHAEFSSQTKGQDFFSFKNGSTAFMPVYQEGQAPLSAIGSTISLFNGKEKPRFVFYALVWDTQGQEEALPDHYRKQLTPVFIPKDVAKQIHATTFSGTSFTGKATDPALLTMQGEDGSLYYGDLFVCTRTGQGLKTEYEVTVESVTDEFLSDFPENLPLPEKPIQVFADENTEYQRNRETQPDQPEANPPEDNKAGFV